MTINRANSGYRTAYTLQDARRRHPDRCLPDGGWSGRWSAGCHGRRSLLHQTRMPQSPVYLLLSTAIGESFRREVGLGRSTATVGVVSDRSGRGSDRGNVGAHRPVSSTYRANPGPSHHLAERASGGMRCRAPPTPGRGQMRSGLDALNRAGSCVHLRREPVGAARRGHPPSRRTDIRIARSTITDSVTPIFRSGDNLSRITSRQPRGVSANYFG